VEQVLEMARLVTMHLRRVVVFVSIFGVIFLATGFLWFQSNQEESRLNAQADQLSFLLDQPAPHPESLMNQADGWEIAYNVVLDGRVARPQDSDLIGRVLDAAADSGLLVIETGTTADGVEVIRNESYTATPILITAIGLLDDIEAYLAQLENSEFASFGVESSNIDQGVVGYQLTLRGLYYSLPEDFGQDADLEGEELLAIPITPVELGAAK
jgi:hypothetical protein